MKKWAASAFFAAVRIDDAEVLGLSFSWGFAHKEKSKKLVHGKDIIVS